MPNFHENRILTADQTDAVDYAIASRRSVRRFLPDPVPQSVVEDILRIAARAPSGTNTQPWKVRVLAGQPKDELSKAIMAQHNDAALQASLTTEYDYYPDEWFSPYIDRRRKVGWDLYGILGLEKTDKQGMHEQHGRNYLFFDAPVGLIFSIDRRLGRGSWLDYGFFMEAICVAARARNLHTCAQAAFNHFHKLIAQQLQFDEHEMLVCGMSLGFEDTSAPENRLRTDRAGVEEFATFAGF